MAALAASADVISEAQLTADGYEGRCTDLNTYQDTTVLTQKGGGAIKTDPTIIVLVQRQNTQEECYNLILANGNYYFLDQAPLVQCTALGIYPAELP